MNPDPATGPRRGPFLLLVGVLLAGALVLLLVLNTLAAAAELREQTLAAANTDTAARVQQLQVDLAARSAPAELARAAAGLGMVPAGNPAFLRIGADGSVTLLGTGAAVVAPAIVPTPPPTGSTALIPGVTTSSSAPAPTSSAAPAPGPAAAATGSPSPGPTASGTPAPTSVTTLPGGAR